ncbi:glutathione ABC transporter substrate-binding protein [Bacillus paranthracis]|uniref:glutathione ABC transporter substrate-binding protein n=1 Tax=Bacillus paranthracis TaxID=2026186 RepID=UPI00094512DF
MRFKRGLVICFITILCLSVFLSGCSSNTKTGNEGSGSNGTKEGGVLTIARLSDADNLDPHFITNIPSASVVYHKVYENLVQRDKNMDFKPMLAKEWKQIDDLNWEFKLQQGVTFQDGAPFNAEAVKKNFERVLDPKVGSNRATVYSMIQEIKVIDEYTVQFVLKYPYSPLLSIFASNEGSILSPKAIDEKGKGLAQHPVGTGPYTFKSWKPGEEIRLEKNKNYWGEKSKIDEVVFKVVPEDATRIGMIETSEAHIAENLPVTEVERVKNSPSMELIENEGLGVEYIGFNVQKKPFDNPLVRQAIAHAIETKGILKGVYNNVGTEINSVMTPKVFGYTKDVKGYKYDINTAKKLLADAGYPNGFKTTIWTNDSKVRMALVEVIQSQLKGIGVDVEIKVMEYGAFLAATNKSEHAMFVGGWGNATGDGDYNQYNLFHSSSHGATGNQFFYSNPEVDKLIEEARKEKDETKRKELYKQLQEIELKDALLVPIRGINHIAATTKNIKGFWIDPSGYLRLEGVELQ